MQYARNLSALFLLLFVTLAAFPQTRDKASLRGRVLDQSGAAVPGARILLESRSTGFSRSAETDAEGQYAMTGLPLTGSYTLSVDKAGFGAAKRDSISLQAGETAIFASSAGSA